MNEWSKSYFDNFIFNNLNWKSPYDEKPQFERFLADKPNTCSRSLCECDKKLAEDLSKLEDTAAMDFRTRFKFMNRPFS